MQTTNYSFPYQDIIQPDCNSYKVPLSPYEPIRYSQNDSDSNNKSESEMADTLDEEEIREVEDVDSTNETIAANNNVSYISNIPSFDSLIATEFLTKLQQKIKIKDFTTDGSDNNHSNVKPNLLKSSQFTIENLIRK